MLLMLENLNEECDVNTHTGSCASNWAQGPMSTPLFFLVLTLNQWQMYLSVIANIFSFVFFVSLGLLSWSLNSEA